MIITYAGSLKYHDESCKYQLSTWSWLMSIFMMAGYVLFFISFLVILKSLLSKNSKLKKNRIDGRFYEKPTMVSEQTPRFARFLIKLLMYFVLFIFVFFIYGNIIFFSDKNCKDAAPNLYEIHKTIILYLWGSVGIFSILQWVLLCSYGVFFSKN
ncbi:c3h4 type zinc finger protein [Anaeramoeba flamelloides]|nr:c3h4 type zinc finger protein [Anaeramoeba flamelloides]